MWIVVLPYFGLTFRSYDDIWRYIFESLKICLEKPKKITLWEKKYKQTYIWISIIIAFSFYENYISIYVSLSLSTYICIYVHV